VSEEGHATIEKKSKQSPIGEIPEDWEVVRLADLIKEIKNGFASGKRDENGIVQIRMNNVTTDGRLIFDSYLKVPTPDNIDEWILKKGDFLFNNTNSYDLVGKSAIFHYAPFPCTFSNHFTRIRFKKDLVLPEIILYHFLILWRKGYFKSVAIRHVGQSAVHTKYILNLKIPLPPLPEQRKIAEILSTVDDAIQKVSDAIARTERLKKGLMQRLLTKGIGHKRFKFSKELGCEIPEEWEVVRLGDVAKKFIGGGTPATKEPKYWNGNIPWIRSVHINKHYIDISSVEQYITEDGLKNSATNIVPKNNLIIATRVGIGKSAVNLIDVAINQDLTGIILDRSRIIPEFIIWFLYSPKTKKLLESFSRGTTIKGITQTSLRKLNIPLPPLHEQQKIAEILSTVDKKLELEKDRKEKLERIKKGLMNDLLTGRMRVKVYGS